MAAVSERRMKLTVLGGFLGSGKTTWLRHQLHHGSFTDAFVLVNEAADVAVDDLLLGESTMLAVLAGGCACCETLEELRRMLRSIADRRVAAAPAGPRFDRLILETSGLADPGRIVEAIRTDPVLVNHVVIGETIVVVDAVNGLDQMRSEPLSRRQIEVADRLVITKVDEADGTSIGRLIATLKMLNPGAVVSGAVRGSPAPLPDASESMAEPLPHSEAGKAAAPICATQLRLDETIDWTGFSVWLSALLHARGDDVMRVKGVIRTPAGRLLLQSVRRAVQSPEILPEERAGPDDDTVAIIGRGYEPEHLMRSLRRFAAPS